MVKDQYCITTGVTERSFLLKRIGRKSVPSYNMILKYGMRWENLQLENNCGFVHQVVTYPLKSHPCINTPKTKTSARTILITNTQKTILMASCKDSGFILAGEEPWCYSRTQQVIKEHSSVWGSLDIRHTISEPLLPRRPRKAARPAHRLPNLLGLKIQRMVETIYARTRHPSVMKQLAVIERLNSESCQKSCQI